MFEYLSSNKLENLGEIDKLLNAYESLILNQEEINIINRTITSNEVEVVIQSPQ
jgi:hypothetical protein